MPDEDRAPNLASSSSSSGDPASGADSCGPDAGGPESGGPGRGDRPEHLAADRAVVDCVGLRKSFRGSLRRRRVDALGGVDLRVGRGEAVGLLGPNGSGKTTLFRIVVGLTRPTSGSATVLGAPAGDSRTRARIGFLAERDDPFPFLTIEETLALHGRLLGLPRAEIRSRSRELMRWLGLEEGRGAVRTLSKGTVRKAALAAVLLGDPELLLLDEPTSGVDPILSHEIATEIRRRRDAGTSVLLSSHSLSDVERLCDRVVVLLHGRVVAAGPTDRLLAREGETDVRFRDLPADVVDRIRAVAREAGADLLDARPARDDLQSFFLRILERGSGTSDSGGGGSA